MTDTQIFLAIIFAAVFGFVLGAVAAFRVRLNQEAE